MSKGLWEGIDSSCSKKQQNEKKVEVVKCTEALSDEMQREALNCYDYICNGAIIEASEALKLHRNTVAGVVKQSESVP